MSKWGRVLYLQYYHAQKLKSLPDINDRNRASAELHRAKVESTLEMRAVELFKNEILGHRAVCHA